MAKIITREQALKFHQNGYSDDGVERLYAMYEGCPSLDLDAVREVCQHLINAYMEPKTDLSGWKCGLCGITHSQDCPVTKATAILKQLESIKEEVK